MVAETTYFAEASNAREYLDALDQVQGLYASLREDVEEIAERLAGLDLSQGVTIDLDSIAQALNTAEGAADDAKTAFENEYGALLELIESGTTVPGIDPFFGDCA